MSNARTTTVEVQERRTDDVEESVYVALLVSDQDNALDLHECHRPREAG